MSHAHNRFNITVDWLTGVLLALTVLFNGLALYVIKTISERSIETSQSSDASIGGGIIALAAVEIALLIVGYRYYKTLSEKWRSRVKTVLKVTLGLGLYYLGFAFYASFGLELLYIVLAPVMYYSVRKISSSNLIWIPFNLMGVCLGVYIVTVGSLNLAPVLALFLMAVFTVWDYIAVDLSSLMGDLVEFSSSVQLPNFLVIPSTLRFDLDGLTDYMTDDEVEKPDNLGFLIGVGDFIFPALLPASVFVSTGAVGIPVLLSIAGICGATVVLRSSLENRESGAPALVWLNTGAIIGFLVGSLFVSESLTVLLGL